MKVFRPTRSNWVNRRVYLGSPHSRFWYRYPSLLRTLERAMRAPTLLRWVHFREAWGGLFLRVFIDSDRSLAIIDSCPGDVAQLGERCRRMAEVGGSIPLVSTLWSYWLLRKQGPFFYAIVMHHAFPPTLHPSPCCIYCLVHRTRAVFPR